MSTHDPGKEQVHDVAALGQNSATTRQARRASLARNPESCLLTRDKSSVTFQSSFPGRDPHASSLEQVMMPDETFQGTDFKIEAARPCDHAEIEQLLDDAFGIDRRTKTSYRFREGETAVAGLSFVARDMQGAIVGTISFWDIRIGETGTAALLLGPLAVKPELKCNGIGLALMTHGLEQAGHDGHRLVILVGDEPYYMRAGFRKVEPGLLIMPGPVDPDRLLYRELVPESLSNCTGLVLPPGQFAKLSR